MGAETEPHRRKATKLPDTEKKEKQKKSRCIIKGNEQCTFSSRIRMGTGIGKILFLKNEGKKNPLMRLDRKSIDNCYQERGKTTVIWPSCARWLMSQIFKDELSSD